MSNLDIDVAGLPKEDRPVLFLVEAYRNCPNRLKTSLPPPSHYLTHFPKHPGCETCIRTKTVRKQHRRQQRDDPSTMKLPLPIKVGSIIVADHLKFNPRDEAVGGRNYALGIMDRYTGWTDGFPSGLKLKYLPAVELSSTES